MWQLRSTGIISGRAALYPAAGGALLDGSESDGTSILAGGNGMTGWATENASFTTGTTLAPDGTTTAATFTENSALGRHLMYQQTSAADYTVTRHFSIYAKMNGRRYLQILPASSGGAWKVSVYFDLQSFVVTDSDLIGGATSISNATMTAAVNGFYKCEFDFILGSTSSDAAYIQFALSDVGTYGAPLSSDSPSYTGDNASGSFLWRAKVT